MEEIKKTAKNIPIYAIEARDEVIIQLAKKGLSFQIIADLFSMGLTRSRVHQIVKDIKPAGGRERVETEEKTEVLT